MAQYRTDLRDIYFNLFEVLEVQNRSGDMGENDLKDVIREYDKFIGNEIYPTREKGDHEGVRKEDDGVKVPECFHGPTRAFYENGWYGLGSPEEWGGMPVPEAITIACTSLSNGANVSWAMYPGLTRGAMNVILQVGSQEQKDLYIPKMMTGEWGGTMCLTESGAGSDVGALKSTATPTEDGKYKISGVKIFISSGESDLYSNNIHLVLARTPGAAEGTKGLSLFIVPRFKVNSDGSIGESNDVHCTKIEEKMGLHGQATSELTFGASGNCEGVLIGKEFEGIQNMFIMMNEARLLCGLQGEAAANLALQLTEQYVGERSQFGTEIKNHPDVKRMMLKMRAMSRGMRALILHDANLFDLAHEKVEGAEDMIALLTPICKGYCSDEGFQVSVDAIQVHGGYGYCSEYGVEQFARDAKIATIYEGTNGIQAIDFVMRKILKDGGKTFMALGGEIQKSMQNPAASEWQSELALLGNSMKDAQEIVQKFGELAKGKKIDSILVHCTDFLSFSGNLVVAWLLLEQALKAQEGLSNANSEDEKSFYQSKVIDFKVFAQHYLSRNLGIARTILGFEEDLTGIEL